MLLTSLKINTKITDTCIICNKPVPDYKPEYCCSGHDCGCMGQPIEPCTCSKECDKAVYDYIGVPFEERRVLANIKLWTPECTNP